MRLENNKEMEVQGVGTVRINTNSGDVKQLEGVQFIPWLAHNLLIVGQLLTKGYSIVFIHDCCIISDNHTKQQVIKIQDQGTICSQWISQA